MLMIYCCFFAAVGIPINNSRSLEISAKFENEAAALGKLVDTWLTYTRLARVFLNNIEVEE